MIKSIASISLYVLIMLLNNIEREKNSPSTLGNFQGVVVSFLFIAMALSVSLIDCLFLITLGKQN